jgi:hypothetical protein
MLTLPRTYERKLSQFDPLLRLRWSEVEEQWLLERQIHRACSLERVAFYIQELRKKGVKVTQPEVVNRMMDGFDYLWPYPPCLGPEWLNTGVARSGLPKLDRLLHALARGSVRRLYNTGNPARDAQLLIDDLDARDLEGKEKRREQFISLAEDVFSDHWDDLAWEEKRRVAVPVTAAGVGA